MKSSLQRDAYSLSGWSAADEAAMGLAVAAARRHFIAGTPGDDDLEGTGRDDRFWVKEGGDDTLHGLGGNDLFDFGGTLTSGDMVFGGAGRDVIALAGTDRVSLSSTSLKDIEAIKLEGRADILIEDGFGDLAIHTSSGAASISVDGSAVKSGHLKIHGSGAGSDVLIGGHLVDLLDGDYGNDTLTGGEGGDKFFYESVFDSLPNDPDLITDFGGRDRIQLFATSAVSSYHIGSTANHAGDVLVSYDSSSDTTTLRVFTNGDDKVDMAIMLNGEHVDLAVRNMTEIVVA